MTDKFRVRTGARMPRPPMTGGRTGMEKLPEKIMDVTMVATTGIVGAGLIGTVGAAFKK